MDDPHPVSLVAHQWSRLLAWRSAALADLEEAWKQLRLARERVPAPETMGRYVDPSEGHDDFLMSIALVAEALSSFVAPPESG